MDAEFTLKVGGPDDPQRGETWVQDFVRKFQNKPLTVTTIYEEGDEVVIVLSPTETE